MLRVSCGVLNEERAVATAQFNLEGLSDWKETLQFEHLQKTLAR